jgi:membrane protein YqaA with SNARE-associated domain
LQAYLVLFAIVLAVNLMPAFGPPTWSIIVIYGLETDLPVVPTVAVGALAAALGRFGLAHAFRLLGDRIPRRMRRNLAAARAAFERRKGAGALALGLFALSPVPSAQLFEAAGLAQVRLAAFTTAFFTGRLISYSLYALSARALRTRTLGEAFMEQLTSPLGIGLQLVMIGGLVALATIDWARVGKRRAPTGSGNSA